MLNIKRKMDKLILVWLSLSNMQVLENYSNMSVLVVDSVKKLLELISNKC